MDRPFARPAADILQDLGVDLRQGLTDKDARARKQEFGANQLHTQRPARVWKILIDQFRGVIVLLLFAAMILAAITNDRLELLAIGVVIVLNAAIGFVSELRAVRSMEALRHLGETYARVRRCGQTRRVASTELVPGDIVIVEAGDIISADMRIVRSSNMLADESTLTGESVPVEKGSEPVSEDATLGDRRCMLYKGTAVTRGSGECVVWATGMGSELGHITSLMLESDEGETPLERRLETLGRRIVWLSCFIAALVVVVGLYSGKDTAMIIKTAIALTVAAVPEGLPIVATLALTRGMWRMAKRNVLIKNLDAVETLGATTVIFTDKTGTLTENRMTVRRVICGTGQTLLDKADADQDPDLRDLLEVGILCNNASLDADDHSSERSFSGDPMEVALLVAGIQAGVDPDATRAAYPKLREHAFDSSVNMMATLHNAPQGAVRVAVKGAPEAVLGASSSVAVQGGCETLDERSRSEWIGRNVSMAQDGLRVLAIAQKTALRADEDPYRELTLLGLIGLIDPPRKSVGDAILGCQRAGVRVVMVTGDQGPTARFIAGAVGIRTDSDIVLGQELSRVSNGSIEPDDQWLNASIFARVTPAQKLELVKRAQRNGEIVAMLGDGVNDAPALKSANIGVGMGKRGTDVAREASDMILRDDAFDSIVVAIEQGRVIFGNIRTFIRYLLSCNLSEILVVLLGVAAQTPLPVLPLQILFLNLVTDVFPAMALGIGEGDPHAMDRPPRRPDEPVLTRRHWIGIAASGFLIAVTVFLSLLISLHLLNLDQPQSVTVSFLTLAFAQLWHAFNMRQPGSGIWKNQITTNRYLWMAIALCTLLLIAAVHVPWMAQPLQTGNPGWRGWAVVGIMSLIPLVVLQICISLRSVPRRAKQSGPV